MAKKRPAKANERPSQPRKQPSEGLASFYPAGTESGSIPESDKGGRVRFRPSGKSDAQLWADADPPLRDLIGLLEAIESYGENLPDIILAFDPIIQAIRVPLVELGHLGADQSLTAHYARQSLPNLLITSGVAKTTQGALALRLSAVVVALKLQRVRNVSKAASDTSGVMEMFKALTAKHDEVLDKVRAGDLERDEKEHSKSRSGWTLDTAIPEVRRVMDDNPKLSQRKISKLTGISHGLVGGAQKELRKRAAERARGSSTENPADPRTGMAERDLALLDARYESIRTRRGDAADCLKDMRALQVEYDTLAEKYPGCPEATVRRDELFQNIQAMKAQRSDVIEQRQRHKKARQLAPTGAHIAED